ncbi:MAG: polyprenyl synthetase family protein [Leptospiraceae bacterium]|nr:polyprenyl synthetase family protein [Leptospiraceae bacterium]
MNFHELYSERKAQFESFFQDFIFSYINQNFHPNIAQACIYSLNAKGKRFRPVLAISSFLSIEETITKSILLAGSALECIHTYSLIHDDLPAMDNDDYRRGIPTCHKKFGEATAILAGDALNSLAFGLLSQMEFQEDNQLIPDCIQTLHRGAGGSGMVSGQMEDLLSENNPNKSNIETLKKIHTEKTGALITSSILIGNRLTKDYSSRDSIVKQYGETLGILFQITDDILDEESTLEEMGKTPGKDLASGKLTYPAFFGMEKSKKLRDEARNELEELAIKMEKNGNFFLKLPEYIANRKN